RIRRGLLLYSPDDSVARWIRAGFFVSLFFAVLLPLTPVIPDESGEPISPKDELHIVIIGTAFFLFVALVCRRLVTKLESPHQQSPESNH
ncbi:MAG: hypothetical protein AAGJ79_05480, partial [Verrucomicrobiota bacterium]